MSTGKASQRQYAPPQCSEQQLHWSQAAALLPTTHQHEPACASNRAATPHLHSAISADEADAISRGATVCWNSCELTMS